MLRAAARAPSRLRERTARVAAFLRGRMNLNGGFRGRASASDLYYTVFGLAGLAALGAPAAARPVRQYLETFGDGESLDFLHLACLARCWASLAPALSPGGTSEQRAARAALRRRLRDRLRAFRSADGGYNAVRGAPTATAYACFLALGAHQDLGARAPVEPALARCIAALRTQDGAFANEPGQARGLTAPTAAAAVVLAELGRPVGPGVAEWLLARAHRDGGFTAAPSTPIPDLLSTATALHALVTLGAPTDGVRQPCLDFIDTLWSDTGGFRGHWADDAVDCEYTWYGLLALGHLGG
jgi:hypothetical protein